MIRRCLLAIAAFVSMMRLFADSPNVYREAMERVSSLDPIRAASLYAGRATTLVYETPLEVEYGKTPYTLKAGLCDLPEISDDGLEYVFRIRRDSRFVDDACFPNGKGRRVVADDIVYTLNRLADRKNASSGMWLLDRVADVRARDSRTVVITLKRPLHIFKWFMTMAYTGVVPHEAVEHYGVRFGGVAVGSGPFKLHNWVRNHEMVYRRNELWPDWKTADGNLDEVRYLVVDDASTKWLMFMRGELDLIDDISRDNWDAAVGSDGKLRKELVDLGMKLQSGSLLEVDYIGINMNNPVLGKNRKLRQALNCAFDGEAWVRFMNGRVDLSDGPVPDVVPNRLREPAHYACDLERAKRLLAEAGYPNGIDGATGRRLVLSVSLGRANQDIRETMELFQSFYQRIGVVIEPKFMTWNAFLKSVSDGNCEMFRMAWLGDYVDEENFLQLFHSRNVSPGSNHANYVNPAFDAEYDAAMAALDENERLKHWHNAERIVREDCPWVFLDFPKKYTMTGPAILNFHQTDFPYAREVHLRKVR